MSHLCQVEAFAGGPPEVLVYNPTSGVLQGGVCTGKYRRQFQLIYR